MSERSHRARGPALARAAVLAAAALALGACKREAPTASAPAARPSAGPVASARGLDRVGPGELAEGPLQFFGLTFPRDTKVLGSFDTFVDTSVPAELDRVLGYVRDRIDGGQVELSTVRRELRWAHVRGTPERNRVHVEVSPLGDGRTRLLVRDVTGPAFDPNLSETDRWKQAGRTPEGKLMDPQHAF